jgi:signal peptide peptidase SppA
MPFHINLNMPGDEIPYFSNWLGPWACHSSHITQLQAGVGSLDVRRHLASGMQQDAIDRADEYEYSNVQGVAIIPINGVMLKHVASYGMGTSTVKVRRLVSKALADPAVKAIALKLDTPGGAVAGTMELAEDIAAAGKEKPTMAFCSDLTASAGYWVASQCGRIYANEMASVGSIGTYCVVSDSSKAYEAAGVTVHVVRAGAFKGAMTEGTEITDEHLAEAQRIVDGINAKFLETVAAGRGMSLEQVAKLADGRVHLAGQAKAMGLVDDVASWERAFTSFVASLSPVSQSAVPASEPASSTLALEEPMSIEQKPATASELRAALPRAGADFVLACLEKSMTLVEAQGAYMQHLVMEAEKNAAAAAAIRKPGVKAVRNGRRYRAEDMMPEDEEEKKVVPVDDEMPEEVEEEVEEEENPEMAWHRAVNQELRLCGNDRRRAVASANRKHPGLRAAMLRQVNARVGRRAIVR